ncbi:RNA helicase [Flammula alnicola]|nr:RNA helicase [Flammula alnicola]
MVGSSVVSHCPICISNVTGGDRQWKQHVAGRRHLENAAQAPTTTAKAVFCDLCQAMIENRHWQSHMNGEKHKSREVFTKYKLLSKKPKRINMVGTQNIATITTSLPFSKCVFWTSSLHPLKGCRLSSPRKCLSFLGCNPGTARSVTSRIPLRLLISLKQAHIGRYEDRLEFIFQDAQLEKLHNHSNSESHCWQQGRHEALRPTAPYVPRSRGRQGIKPPALTAIRYVVPLPRADIPSHLQTILAGSDISYSRHFKHLLWIEEFKMEQDLERYDIPDATLMRHNKYYYLSVPGLAEKRPSVLVGDRIFVQEQGATDGRWFEGHVHVLRQAEVGLCFHGTFGRYSEGRRFHVRFKLNRIPARREHQAMDTVFAENRVLFPVDGHLSPKPPTVSLRLFNALISKNAPQLQAIASILSLRPGSPPFVVFGPPGTGKTITIIEAIRQILANNPNARILACAPSNSAADLIASRLRGALASSDLFRFYASSRSKSQVPDDLVSYTYTSADGHFAVPLLSRLKRYRVIVSTCVSASFAAGVGMARGHFSHIFIDEAGQATEPETFVSIKMLADSKTNVILSGDPKQLGPIIRSPVARELGLETSYLERLMLREAYSLKTSYGKSIAKLTKNFRSHNAIISFPNERFYDNELQQCATPSITNKYLNSPYLPAKKFPIVFHAVSGKDDREASSPSFFNIDEILQVKSYVQRLKEDRRFLTTDADIGIIAPYHAQCLKLRTALRNVADGVKVGSVEEFQGQERSVIIISTVRSSKEFVEYDLRHTLGFVANPRRFNVAVTRTQALLIVVGDPQVLSLDPLWRSFLNYVYLNGGWTGPSITWDPTAPVDEAGGYDKGIREAAKLDMNEFARRMESLTMAEVDDLDANVDRPWRDVE